MKNVTKKLKHRTRTIRDDAGDPKPNKSFDTSGGYLES
jgi:hypothetical protein